MPDEVVPITEVVGQPVAQVCVGSCVNSSFEDLVTVAAVLKGKRVHPSVSMTVTPGSKQVFTMIAENGALADLIGAGARVLEAACGPCLGIGQAPATGIASMRSMNRNFKGRSGTSDDNVYLASPEACAAAALTGVITDPRTLGDPPVVAPPRVYAANDNMIVQPFDPADAATTVVLRGPNIKPVPLGTPMSQSIEGRVLIKVGDNITTDHILPAGAAVLPLRSNIPAISEFTFQRVDTDFVARAKDWGGGIIVGGSNYGQGSSREHAALAPMHLGVRVVIAKSFARIHLANLINNGILPLVFGTPSDYDTLDLGDELVLSGVRATLQEDRPVDVVNRTKGLHYTFYPRFSRRELAYLLAGGLLNHTRGVEA
jgi:aconitate hydratase